MISNIDKVQSFVSKCVKPGYKVVYLEADASLRTYARIYDQDRTSILMNSSLDPQSMQSFLKVSEVLSSCYSTPKIIAVDTENYLALIEDLGQGLYTNILREKPELEQELYKYAVELLVDLHQKPIEVYKDTFASYNNDLLLDEVLLFIDWYYPFLRKEKVPHRVRREFIDMWLEVLPLLSFSDSCLVLRDYHADNLLWLDARSSIEKVGLLDYQDAVIGSTAYDLVSLLEDARRDVSSVVVDKMLELYVNRTNVKRDKFMTEYNILGAQRNSKILGIFARKYLQDKNIKYLMLLPRVLAYLSHDLKHNKLASLRKWYIKYDLLNSNDISKSLSEL